MCLCEPFFLCLDCGEEFNVMEHQPHTWKGTCVFCNSFNLEQTNGHEAWTEFVNKQKAFKDLNRKQ